MPSITDVKSLMEMGLLSVAAFAFVFLAVWGFLQLKPVITNNTRAVDALTAAISPMQQNQIEAVGILHELNEKVATREDLNRIHSRIDDQARDVSVIMGRVS